MGSSSYCLSRYNGHRGIGQGCRDDEELASDRVVVDVAAHGDDII